MTCCLDLREQIARDIELLRDHLRKHPGPAEGALPSFAWHRWQAADEVLIIAAGIARGTHRHPSTHRHGHGQDVELPGRPGVAP